MQFYVYLIVTKKSNSLISYVGYTKDLNKRLKDHNKSKGAKFTKGNKWVLIYSRKYSNKISAMKNEYKLKKNIKIRNKLKFRYLNK